jgi:hypothetical protein
VIKLQNNFSSRLTLIILTVCTLVGTLNFGPASSAAHAVDPSEITVLSSENISTVFSNSVLKVYLNTFRPNDVVDFKVVFHNNQPITVINDAVKITVPTGGGIQFSFKTGATLNQGIITKSIREIDDENGNPIVQVFPTPPDFPITSYTGDTSLLKSKDILSTPVVTDGTYAIAQSGTNIKFFVKSPNNLIGFRKLTDAKSDPTFSGTPFYGYLEQKDFTVSATSPGVWHLLDSRYQLVSRINEVKTKFGMFLPEGHGMTIAPSGNPVVITAVTRTVDSSWLKRSYKLPILDCDIAEVVNGVAVKEFSFWDWAVANKAVSEPILDAMALFNDPQNPTSSPIDVCHANSLQYYKATNEFLISLRSPSLVFVLDPNLKVVKKILNANNALQHFARFVSKTEITALGNYSLDKISKFLDFKLVNGEWQLREIPFPVHVTYCGNTQYLDSTHIWLGGGCGPFTDGVLGAIYKVSGDTMAQVGAVNMKGFNYTYRADIFSN